MIISFSLILLILNVIFFVKKKYLYLFIPCMLFLPGYYGIKLSSSFPVINVTRIMCMVFFIYAFINKRNSINIKNISITHIPKEVLLIFGYFLLRILSNLYYVGTYGQSVKTILLIIFEQLFFLIAFYLIWPTRDELLILTKTIVWVATAFFILGFFESITYLKIFDALYVPGTGYLNERYYRLGLLRSTTSFYMPGMFANMCILVLPLIIYMYELSRQKRYLVSVGLCILAVIHSGSRANIFYLIFIFIFYFLYIFRQREKRISFLKNTVCILAGLFIFIMLASAANPYFKYFYGGSVKSVLNEIGFDFDLSEGAPADDIGYGENYKSGSQSRTRQLTGIIYTARNNLFFGLGSGAQNRGDVRYYWDGIWHKGISYDLGIVQIFCDEGVIGLIGITLLLTSFFLLCKKNRKHIPLIIVYLLSTLNTANMFSFLFVYIAMLLAYNINLSKKNNSC